MKSVILVALVGISFVACNDAPNGREPGNTADAEAHDVSNGSPADGNSSSLDAARSSEGGADARTTRTGADSTAAATDGASGDSGVRADSSEGSTRTCVGDICAATEVCVAYRTVGGALIQPDGSGNCPMDRHLEPIGDALVYCANDYAYRCVPLVGCNMTPITCGCAMIRNADSAGTCPTDHSACSDPRQAGWLDSVAQLICEQQVP